MPNARVFGVCVSAQHSICGTSGECDVDVMLSRKHFGTDEQSHSPCSRGIIVPDRRCQAVHLVDRDVVRGNVDNALFAKPNEINNIRLFDSFLFCCCCFASVSNFWVRFFSSFMLHRFYSDKTSEEEKFFRFISLLLLLLSDQTSGSAYAKRIERHMHQVIGSINNTKHENHFVPSGFCSKRENSSFLLLFVDVEFDWIHTQ